jgi:hypothetical protein
MSVFNATLGSRHGGVVAFGGDQVIDAGGYRHHVFTTVGSSVLTLGNAPTLATVDVLAIGAGAGGGRAYGGGGGAGGVHLWVPVGIRGLKSCAVLVGSGGKGGIGDPSAASTAGGQSTFTGLTKLTAAGGGRGANAAQDGGTGGSGGGGGGAQATGWDKPGGVPSGAGVGNPGGRGGRDPEIGGTGYRGPAGGGGGYSTAGGNAANDGSKAGDGGQGANITALIGSLYAGWALFAGMTHVASGGGGGGRDIYPAGYTAIPGIGGPGAGNGGVNTNGSHATSFGSGGGGGGLIEHPAGPLTLSGGDGYQGLIIARYPL